MDRPFQVLEMCKPVLFSRTGKYPLHILMWPSMRLLSYKLHDFHGRNRVQHWYSIWVIPIKWSEAHVTFACSNKEEGCSENTNLFFILSSILMDKSVTKQLSILPPFIPWGWNRNRALYSHVYYFNWSAIATVFIVVAIHKLSIQDILNG